MLNKSKTKLMLVMMMVVSLHTLAYEPARPQTQQPNASLATQNPISRVSGVVQFGMPGDHKYVFCNDEECPTRTLKHIPDRPQPPPPVALAPLAPPQIVEPEHKAHIKKPKQKPHKKRKAAKKPVKKVICTRT